jgi:hypothetical protein
MKFAVSTIAILVLTACAGGPNLDLLNAQNVQPQKTGTPTTGQLQAGDVWISPTGERLQIIWGAFQTADRCIQGTGSLRLPDLPSVEHAWNVALKLTWKENSVVRLKTHAKADGTQAFELEMQKQKSRVQVKVTAQGDGADWSGIQALQSLLNQNALNFNLDIHHDGDHAQYAHLLFFDSAGQLVMDSGSDATGTPGKGLGRAQILEVSDVVLCGWDEAAPRDQG